MSELRGILGSCMGNHELVASLPLSANLQPTPQIPSLNANEPYKPPNALYLDEHDADDDDDDGVESPVNQEASQQTLGFMRRGASGWRSPSPEEPAREPRTGVSRSRSATSPKTGTHDIPGNAEGPCTQ